MTSPSAKTLANLNKAREANGQFGPWQNMVDLAASQRLLAPAPEAVQNALAAAFAGDPASVRNPNYDAETDTARLDAANSFGAWATVLHDYKTETTIGRLADGTPLNGAQAETFLDGLTVGSDSVVRTTNEAFHHFKATAIPPSKKTRVRKPAAKKTPALPAKHILSDDEKRYMSPEQIAGIEAGTIPLGDDPRVAAGEIFDTIYDPEDNVIWNRTSEHSYATNDVYGMRFQTSRPLTEDEQRHLAGCVGYAWAMGGYGEGCSDPYPGATDNAFTIGADSTKSRGDSPGKVVEHLRTFMSEGSPQRKTKDMTRLIEAFPDPDVTVEIYFDSPVETWTPRT